MTQGPLMQFKSHIAGKNADVMVYADRIEWVNAGTTISGLLKGGLLSSMAGGNRKATNTILMRAVQGVSTEKGGIGYTNVIVMTPADKISFRVTKAEAEQVRTTILSLVSGG